MSGAAGQAAGLAVGAAVGSLTGVGPMAGAAAGAGVGGLLGSTSASRAQQTIDTAALKLNMEQFRARAAGQSAIHAQNFRQALAHQVALAGMRGGSGSLVTQFASQAYRGFLDDQQAIEAGLSVAEASGRLSQADIDVRRVARDTQSIGRAISAFDGVNLNAPRQRN